MREYLSPVRSRHERSGRDYSTVSDSELLDTVQHSVFPNFHPWVGFKSNVW